MIREFTLLGLDCPNCAALIEAAIKKTDGVSDASINLMTGLLTVEFDTTGQKGVPTGPRESAKRVNQADRQGDQPEDPRDDLLSGIVEIVARFEPDVRVIEKSAVNREVIREEEKGSTHRETLRLAAGTLILAAGLVFEHLPDANHYIAPALYLSGYLALGANVILRAVKNIAKGVIFDEHFLMTIATLGALALGEYAEAMGVMLFYQIGEFFQDLAVERSRRSIAALMDIRPDYVNLLVNGETRKVHPDSARAGDLFIVRPGEKIPLDGEVIEGEASLDTSALTGESMPRMARAGDTVLSGCVNQNGVLTVRATRTFGQSTASKIIDLMENAAGKKAKTEKFITKFAGYYTPVVVGLAALVAIIPPLAFGGSWTVWMSRSLIFLVISCPCALVLSIPLGYFAGMGAASKKGILIKGGDCIEALGSLDIAVFDKTGTLTKGAFEVTATLAAPGISPEELLQTAAAAEAFSNHPIASSISRKHGLSIDTVDFTEYKEIAGLGVSVNDGRRYIAAGNSALMRDMNIAFEEPGQTGAMVHVAADGRYLGCIVIADDIKADSLSAIHKLKALGVRKTAMLTGDNADTAAAVAKELGIDECYAGLLPQDKVRILEAISESKKPGGKLAFVGDGINDAPVLAIADIGVAMGGLGADAAIEAADIALMTDEPSKLAEAVKIARDTKRVIWQNIIFSLTMKALVLSLGAAGIATMWGAVFADVGVALLAVLNSTRVTR